MIPILKAKALHHPKLPLQPQPQTTDAALILKHAVAHTRDRGNVRRIHRDLLSSLRIFVILTRRIRLPLLAYGPHIFSNNI